ncbi:hypothetical protein K491DRAFT_763567 [Lophiostoma macrostomum CBS 122681]|uniref:Uncharacterized protein n=1 Tax=Lophiostoma macrostomum CBS 122681 TaxID=1314788 RepID=A0A6A6SL13_9PLEO|nr:hypothetical protein K491DRAFT_763567 [Lophiostoma macrostomum CBS 122681]
MYLHVEEKPSCYPYRACHASCVRVIGVTLGGAELGNEAGFALILSDVAVGLRWTGGSGIGATHAPNPGVFPQQPHSTEPPDGLAREVRIGTCSKTATSTTQARAQPENPTMNDVTRDLQRPPLHRDDALSDLRSFQQDPSSGLPTPQHLVAISKRNASESPLLRLPSEVRNRIFAFVYSGEKIMKQKPSDEFAYHRDSDVLAGLPCNLPQICRQLYCETYILPYALPTVIFYYEDTEEIEEWASNLPFVYREAITSVAVPSALAQRWTAKTIFPSIKLVVAIQIRYPPFPHLNPHFHWPPTAMSDVQDVQGVGVEITTMVVRAKRFPTQSWCHRGRRPLPQGF